LSLKIDLGSTHKFLGFSGLPSVVANKRLKAHHCSEGLLILEKPARVLIDTHPWYARSTTLVDAINLQLQAGGKEWSQLGVEFVKQIHFLDPEVSGLAVLATNAAILQTLRNAYGSGYFNFKFIALAKKKKNHESPVLTCELPLVTNSSLRRAIVSHKQGKKSRTQFSLLEDLGDYELWQAQTNYLRPHQIRLHAFELGIAIVGETLYGTTPPIFLSNLKKKFYKGLDFEQPLYSGLHLHLSSVQCETSFPQCPSFEFMAPLPGAFEVLIEKLKRYL
jgi:23S rRNA-/tRNA-specific pseudouridylate synthase